MNRMISSSCEPTREESDVGEEEPCGCCGDGGLEVLGEAPASAEQGEGCFADPSSGQQLEAFDALWALDDFDGPRPAVGEGLEQLLATIDAVGEYMAQSRQASAQRAQQRHGPVAVLHVGGVHQHGEQETLGIGDDMALAPLDPLGSVEAAWAAAFQIGRAHVWTPVTNAQLVCRLLL